MFYVVAQPNPQNEQPVLQDYPLELRLAECNIGDKKAVLSWVRLEGFRDARGERLGLPNLP